MRSHTTLGSSCLAVLLGMIAITTSGTRANIVIDFAHQWNQVSASGISGGPENTGFLLSGSSDFNVSNASPVSYAGSSLSYTGEIKRDVSEIPGHRFV